MTDEEAKRPLRVRCVYCDQSYAAHQFRGGIDEEGVVFLLCPQGDVIDCLALESLTDELVVVTKENDECPTSS